MEFICETGLAAEAVGDVLVVGVVDSEIAAIPLLRDLDQSLHGALASMRQQGEFTGKANATKMLHTLGLLPTQRLLLVGLGPEQEVDQERLRQSAGSAVQALRTAGLASFVTVLHGAVSLPEALRSTLEGYLLGDYSFDQYKSNGGQAVRMASARLLFADEERRFQAINLVAEAVAVCDGVMLARDLVNHPGNVATPSYLADRAVELAASRGLDCRIMQGEELESIGMGGLLAVAKGSDQPPRFIELQYHGAGERKRPVVLIGKGVTFDSGGISLKPREGMEKMKYDMAGAAAVLGVMSAAVALRLPVNLIGLVPTAENLPSGGAYKPGDVVVTMSGRTVEIVNTDAEGRMLLCDALHYAKRFKPAAVVDVATLTGACLVALGNLASGVMGNNERLLRQLKQASAACGERIWELPLWEEYGELMKSDIADMKNAGGANAGTVSAAWFLSNFAAGMNWAHLDIAGTAWEEKGAPYKPKGATGVGVRLLLEFLRLQ